MKKLKLACADFTFPLLSHEKVMDLVVLLECKGIDIGLFSGRSHLQPDSEFHQIRRRANRLRKQVMDRGLTVTDVYLQQHNDFSRYAINHPDVKIREFARTAFIKLIDYAEESGADHITILPGIAFSQEFINDSLKRCYEELAWRVEKVEKSSLSFGVEAHIGSPFENPQKAKELVDAVKGLTLTLDFTHFIYGGHTQQEVEHLLPHASHFHARGAKEKRLQTSMTDNIIDYKKIIQQLKNLRYKGWIGLEYIWIDWEGCNDIDTVAETIRLRDIIKSAIAEDRRKFSK